MIKLVDRYVGRATVLGTVPVWLGLTVLYVLISLLGELRSQQNDYTASDALWYVALTAPRMAYEIFPIAALLGALVGVGGLAASNELVAFRTSGISRVRLAGAALAGTLLLTVPIMVMGEWVAPAAEHQARAFRLSEMVGQAIIGGPRGMWMRDGQQIVNIQLPLLSANRGQQSVEFKNVVIYTFSDGVDLKSITRAASADHDGNRWILQDVSEVSFDEQGATVHHQAARPWLTEVRPELLDSAVTRPKNLSLRALAGYLTYLRENGLDDTVYQAAFWEKAMFPLSAVALVLAGMPFVFGAARSNSVGVRMFAGMVLGGLFLIISRMAQNFGDAYQLPAALSNGVPPLLLVLGAIYVLRRSV